VLPTSIAAADGRLYIADTMNARVLVFGFDGALRGVVPAGNDTAAGVGIDCEGRLIVHPGGGSVRRSLGLSTYSSCGTLLAGPFDGGSDRTRWQRVQAEMDTLTPGSHVRFFTLTSDTLDGMLVNRPPLPICCDSTPASPAVAFEARIEATLDTWRAGMLDASDILAYNAAGKYLWFAAELIGDGSETPKIRQIRVTHDEEGWMRHLPAIYSQNEADARFLERVLAGFESVFAIEDTLLDRLPRLFDPYAAPDLPTTGWLDWLAGWVDAGLREQWPADRRRRVVADAFSLHAKRGTIESVRRLVALYTGATPYIEELGSLGAWSLGVTNALGVETALAAADAQGAVVGTTAVTDHSELIREEHYGAPAFGNAAHRFSVQVYAAELTDADGLDRVRQVIDREKPAHTSYHLCAIEPRLRVGAQARLGIDTVVAGPPQPTALGDAAGIVLSRDPARGPWHR
jgi:phage tail-like protein